MEGEKVPVPVTLGEDVVDREGVVVPREVRVNEGLALGVEKRLAVALPPVGVLDPPEGLKLGLPLALALLLPPPPA